MGQKKEWVKKAGVKKSRGKTQRGGKDRARLGTARAILGTVHARLLKNNLCTKKLIKIILIYVLSL